MTLTGHVNVRKETGAAGAGSLGALGLEAWPPPVSLHFRRDRGPARAGGVQAAGGGGLGAGQVHDEGEGRGGLLLRDLGLVPPPPPGQRENLQSRGPRQQGRGTSWAVWAGILFADGHLFALQGHWAPGRAGATPLLAEGRQ